MGEVGSSRAFEDFEGFVGGACAAQALLKEKDGAVRGQDFEKAGSLRDREMELKAQISAITSAKRETDAAELEGGIGPVVTESDIAAIVAAWTGIPVEKVQLPPPPWPAGRRDG